MKITGLLIILFFIWAKIFSQKWEKTIGYPTRDEWPNDVIEYYDKGYYIAGGYHANQTYRVWNFKTNINGTILWDKTIIDPPELVNFASTRDSLGNIYVCGRATINGIYCPLLAKFDPCGETMWCKMFYDNYFTIEGCFVDIIINKNNEIILLALVQNEDQVDQIFLFGYSNDGVYLWKNAYASKNDYPLISTAAAFSVNPISNEYIISGYCYWPFPDNPSQVFLRPLFIGVDSIFNEKWIMPFAIMDSVFGEAYKTIPLNDSILMGVGKRRFYNNVTKSLLTFFNINGQELGFNQIENDQIGAEIKSNFIMDIERINDSLFFVSSNFGNNYEQNPFGEFVIDSVGDIFTLQTRPNTTASAKLIKSIENNYLIATVLSQNSDWDIYLYKVNQYLEMVPFDTNQYTYDSLCPEPVPSGTINLGDCDLITDIGEIPSPKEYYESIKKIPVTAYPNPASSEITLAFQNTDHHTNMLLECYNIYGMQVHTEKIWKGQQETKIHLNGWAKGLYFAVVKSEGTLAGSVRFIRQ